MAHMIPSTPREFPPESREGEVFNALKKLSDEYYVFHSVSATSVTSNNYIYEREVDFVIANQKRGVLAIEVKAGSGITYNHGKWIYTSGDEMKHGGPYLQISSAKRTLMNKVQYHADDRIKEIYDKCKFLHAVWFPQMAKEDLVELERKGLPSEADLRITLCAEDMINPSKKIGEIYATHLPKEKYNTEETKMDEEDFKLLLDEVFCPHFNLILSPRAKSISLNEKMNQLLKEQYMILEFLEEQPSAVINGAAGTGKTMLAVEKARRHSEQGEKVLFLCYNRLLCDMLIEENKNNPIRSYRKKFDNVDFMTISKLAKDKTGRFDGFDGLFDWIMECIDGKQELGYKHIIIDEGQDFGMFDSNEDNEKESAKQNITIIDALQEAVREQNGTFYLFYDKYQMVQGGEKNQYSLPDCIQNSDCRLTLHKNCRNTQEIAKTSFTPIKGANKRRSYNSVCSWNEPIVPVLHLASYDEKKVLHEILDKLNTQQVEDVVILTEGKFEYSIIANDLEDVEGTSSYKYYVYKDKKYKVSTCICFKGLEADAIILIDLNKDSFFGKKGLEFYVGTSRAKQYLDLICDLKEDEYYSLAHDLDENAPNRGNPNRMRNILASIFSAEIDVE